MCLAIPMRVISISNNNIAFTEVNNVKYQVDVTMIEDLKIGEYLIVHAGFAIEKINKQDALEKLKIWQKITAHNKETKDEI